MSENQQIEQLQKELKIEDATNKINDMISQSTDALICGPNCQKNRKIAILRQKYLDAQENVNTAPSQLESAAKEYYTYTQGTAGYNKYLASQTTTNANSVSSTAAKTFSTALENANDLTSTYNKLHATYTNTFDLYKRYLIDNEVMQGRINTINTDTITSDRRAFYESQGIDNLNNWYIFLKWMYISLVVVYILGLFLASSNYRFLTKLFILLIFIIYPFVINYIILFIYSYMLKIYKMLPKNAYI
jgi:hypothetical protein